MQPSHDEYYPDVDAIFEERYCIDEPWIDYPKDYYDDSGFPTVGATDEDDQDE